MDYSRRLPHFRCPGRLAFWSSFIFVQTLCRITCTNALGTTSIAVDFALPLRSLGRRHLLPGRTLPEPARSTVLGPNRVASVRGFWLRRAKIETITYEVNCEPAAFGWAGIPAVSPVACGRESHDRARARDRNLHSHAGGTSRGTKSVASEATFVPQGRATH